MNSVTESENKQYLIQESEELMTEVEFLTEILDQVVAMTREQRELFHGRKLLEVTIQPYLDRKKPPEPEIKPWTRWRHENGYEYILCLLGRKYQLIDTELGRNWIPNITDTPLGAFGGDLDQFTQVTEGES